MPLIGVLHDGVALCACFRRWPRHYLVHGAEPQFPYLVYWLDPQVYRTSIRSEDLSALLEIA